MTEKELIEEFDKKLSEVRDGVRKVNQKFYKKYGWQSHPRVSLTVLETHMLTFRIDIHIYGQSLHIYDSYEGINGPLYYEKSDKYETYFAFIKRRFLEIKEELNQIKI